MIQLSIIVPVYNTRQFLPRCLESLLRQGLQEGEYEVICVDDGSTDGSAEVLATYAREYPEVFRVLTQENRGAAMARNAGMDVARGEYLVFLDSDDFIIDGGYGYLIHHFAQTASPDAPEGREGQTGQGTPPDLISFWAVTMNAYQLAHRTEADTPEGKVIFEGDGVELYNRDGWNGGTTKLLRRAFVEEHGLRFQPLYICEDALFVFQLCALRPRVVMTNCNIYRYMQDNHDSAVRSTDRTTFRRKIDAMLQLMERFNGYLDQGETALEPGILHRINALVLAIYTRSLAVGFSRVEWRQQMDRLTAQPHHTLRLEGKWSPVAKLLNATATSYPLYRFASFLYVEVFNRFVRKRLE